LGESSRFTFPKRTSDYYRLRGGESLLCEIEEGGNFRFSEKSSLLEREKINIDIWVETESMFCSEEVYEVFECVKYRLIRLGKYDYVTLQIKKVIKEGR
jgi:hypothetical protein